MLINLAKMAPVENLIVEIERMKNQEGQLDVFFGAQHLYHLPRNECCPSSLPS